MNLQKLAFWAQKNYNVLLEGRHGTGKTKTITQTFNEQFGEHGKDWLYFSAATMDAWVDFVGVPRETIDEDTGVRYLDLIRPRALANDTVKAIFFDEFNRAPAKTRNAVMELLQFKSINGKKFKNLRVIWAAINPDEEGMYDVERIDPAQEDRFDVKIKVAYEVSHEYFFENYGSMGKTACAWWESLDEESRFLISPRRLETVLRMFLDGGDISDVLPLIEEGINVSELIVQLSEGAYKQRMQAYYSSGDTEAAREALINENFYHAVESEILSIGKNGLNYIKFFVPLMPPEKMVKVFMDSTDVSNWMGESLNYYKYQHIFDPVLAANESTSQRSATGVQPSKLARIKLWKKRSGGDDLLSDVEYVDQVSDSRMNIVYFREMDNTRLNTLARLKKIIDHNESFDKQNWTKVLGPMIELYNVANTDYINDTRTYLGKLRDIFNERLKVNFTEVLKNDLPGLRLSANDAVFKKVVERLHTDGVLAGNA